MTYTAVLPGLQVNPSAPREEALEIYSALFQHLPVGIFIYHLEDFSDERSLRLIAANPASCRITKVPSEALVGRTLDENFPNLRLLGVPRRFAEVALTGTRCELGELEYSDGRVGRATFVVEAFPLPGRCVGVIVDDITERKRGEEARQRLEQDLATTLNSIGDAVIGTDTEGRVVRMNPVAEQMTGWSLMEAVGQPLTKVFHILNEETRLPIENPVDKVLLHGTIVGLANHTVLVSRSGRERPISESAAPIRDAAGNVTGVVLVFRDMTKEHRLVEQTKRAEREFRQALDAVAEAVAIRRGDHYVYVNPAFVRLLGDSSAEELLKTPCIQMLHPDEHTRGQAEMDAVVAGGGTPQTTEWRFLRKDGSTITMEWGVPQVVEFGGAPAYLNSGRDVTERKRLEAQLVMSDRLASVGTLAAGVAHEINNPLAYIMANLEILSSELEGLGDRMLPEQLADVRELLSVTVDGAERISKIVRGLKTFARANEERLVDLDVRRVLDVSINMVMNEVRHRARLTKNYGKVPLVHVDEARLGQVIVNLVVNAAQAIQPGRVHENEIEVTTRTSLNGWAVIEVRDTGSGMSAATQARIFDPFFTTKAIGEGTGLGLSICHSLVASMGGCISVESEVGRGSLFRVSLPPATADVPSVPPTMTPKRSLFSGRLLVIDDEEQIGFSLRNAFRGEHEVATVKSGRQAIEVLAGGSDFDVILCDLMMPEMTGVDVYEEIARRWPHLLPRMLFMTGGAFTAAINTFLESVPDRLIEKPFPVQVIRDRIDAMLLHARVG